MNSISVSVNLGPLPEKRQSIFYQAQGFYLAGNRCLLNIEVGPGVTQCLVSPAVVNHCLSLELFLKALLAHEKRAVPKIHKKKELFSLVGDQHRDSIKAGFSQVINDPKFEPFVNTITDFFIKVRYGFEYEIPAVHEQSMSALAQVCYAYVAQTIGYKPGLDPIRD